jgi:Putative Flp pilus-assembly TadE/G-like
MGTIPAAPTAPAAPAAPAGSPPAQAPARRVPPPRSGRTPRTRPGYTAASQADRGSVTILVVFFTIISLALAALLVDVGNALNARERAADIAEQAARAGANDISIPALRAGRLEIDTATACARAMGLVQAYGTQSGFQATADCAPPSPQQITVTVSVTTRPLIAASLGNFTVRATATAEPVCGITRAGQC